jgi:hypothetical protein
VENGRLTELDAMADSTISTLFNLMRLMAVPVGAGLKACQVQSSKTSKEQQR